MSPLKMACCKFDTPRLESKASESLGPTPETPFNIRNNCMAWVEEKP
jgi:hypothetical protein